MSELRPITEEEVVAFHAQVARAFEGSAPTREEIELRRRAMELDRTLGLFQGDAIFGSPLAPWYAYHF
jgi:hypothetical protein